MNTITTITPRPVHRGVLTRALGCRRRIPADFTFRGPVELFADWDSRTSLGVFDIEVAPSSNPSGRRGAGKHRIFAHINGRRIPVGRLAQAKYL